MEERLRTFAVIVVALSVAAVAITALFLAHSPSPQSSTPTTTAAPHPISTASTSEARTLSPKYSTHTISGATGERDWAFVPGRVLEQPIPVPASEIDSFIARVWDLYTVKYARVKATPLGSTAMPIATVPTATVAAVEVAAEVATAPSEAGPAAPEYSTTNVQVQGVDEQDIVKTNGTHIFIARGRQVVVVDARTAEPKVTLVLDVSESAKRLVGNITLYAVSNLGEEKVATLVPHAYTRGLYVTKDGFIVLAELGYEPLQLEPAQARHIAPPYYYGAGTLVLICDSHGALKAWLRLDGRLVDSRLYMGERLVIVTSTPYTYGTSIKVNGTEVPPESTGVLATPTMAILVTQLDLESKTYSALSLLGPSPRTIYMSASGNLYLVMRDLFFRVLLEAYKEARESGGAHTITVVTGKTTETVTIPSPTPVPPPPEPVMVLAKISTSKEGLALEKARVFEGMIVRKQWQLDEYRGVLRIAAEEMEGWRRVVVLTLNATTLEDIGRVEVTVDQRIHGIRFIGPRVYLVTYRNVDPLYAIDLSDPANPRILGYLKGPGFDEYLHPVNETALIGVGYEPETRNLRVSTYLITPDSVKLVSRIRLGHGWSPVLGYKGHLAFLYDPRHSLVAFPLYIHDPERIQGVIVVKFDPKTLKLGETTALSHPGAVRVLYIDDRLYTVSMESVAVYKLPSLEMMMVLKLG